MNKMNKPYYVKFEAPKDLVTAVYEAVRVAKQSGKVRKGTNETTKAVERGLSRIDGEHETTVAGADRAAAEAARAEARLGHAFEHGQELATAQRRQRDIAELLTPDASPPAPSSTPPALVPALD